MPESIQLLMTHCFYMWTCAFVRGHALYSLPFFLQGMAKNYVRSFPGKVDANASLYTAVNQQVHQDQRICWKFLTLFSKNILKGNFIIKKTVHQIKLQIGF